LAVDITFVLDVSVSIGNINDTYFKIIKNFAKDVSRFLDIGMNDSLVGVILFGRDAWISFDLQEYPVKDDLIEAIDNIVSTGITKHNRTGTNIPAALKLLETAGQSHGALRLRNDQNKPKIVIFVTDGRVNIRRIEQITGKAAKKDDKKVLKDAADSLHEQQIYQQIFAIGVNGKKKIDRAELELIATDKSKVFIFDKTNLTVFEELHKNLTSMACNRKLCHNDV